jgi:hypothetical protein
LTTQTPKRTPAKSRQPTGTPIPASMKRWRPLLTIISLVLVVVAAFFIALNLGTRHSIYSGVAMLVVALTMTVFSQLRVTYAWADNDGPVVEHADEVPAKKAAKAPAAKEAKTPRQRRRRGTFEIPALKPSWALGPEFRYIVTYARWLAEQHRDIFTDMSTFWDTIDWDSDETDSEFRDVVEFLYDKAREVRTWDEDATRGQLLAGTANRDNPFVFIAEMESYHSLLGAVATLMLVRTQNGVTSRDFDVVMQPWTDLGLPYRLADVIFFRGKDGEYHTKDAEARQAAPTAPGSPVPAVDVTSGTSRPGEDLDAVIAAHTAAAPPVPWDAPVQPVVPERHVEPERDDVPDPTTDDIVMAAEQVISSQFGSVSMIQRKMRIGFALACKVMTRLSYYGVVGPPDPSGGAREVMVKVDELDELLDFIREQEAERNNS